VIEKTSYALGRNDEEPNIALAEELYITKNAEGIKEIVHYLYDSNQLLANDCIKILYEIGERKPGLISEYVLDFIHILKSKNNRLVWGGMTALAKIASLKAKEIFEHIDTVFYAYENGSVITRDNSISVFAEVARADKKYSDIMFQKINSHLESCRSREVAQHAERAFVCVNKDNCKEFMSVLLKRHEDLNDAQKKRVGRLIKRIENGKFDG
jgi:hypothetical protein